MAFAIDPELQPLLDLLPPIELDDLKARKRIHDLLAIELAEVAKAADRDSVDVHDGNPALRRTTRRIGLTCARVERR